MTTSNTLSFPALLLRLQMEEVAAQESGRADADGFVARFGEKAEGFTLSAETEALWATAAATRAEANARHDAGESL